MIINKLHFPLSRGIVVGKKKGETVGVVVSLGWEHESRKKLFRESVMHRLDNAGLT